MQHKSVEFLLHEVSGPVRQVALEWAHSKAPNQEELRGEATVRKPASPGRPAPRGSLLARARANLAAGFEPTSAASAEYTFPRDRRERGDA